ncbi:restriction endonuclease subunit S [Microbispora rosea]|uniref:restriction endonuclease subunit S n=1 Tax=Microbispora rosea TaxID=58117 RepID=UPI0037BB80F3
MTRAELPSGWAPATLGEIAHYQNGRGFKKSEWSDSGRPIVRIQNLTGSGATFNYFSGNLDERHTVKTGDLLISWAATLGAFIWDGPEGALNQHIFKVTPFVDKKFLYYLVQHALEDLYSHTHGSGMVHITKEKFDTLPVAIPPLREQRRIVVALEDHLSRLDAAVGGVKSGLARLRQLSKQIIISSVPEETPSHWEVVPVREAGKVELGRQRHPDWHNGPHMRPYLRVANVFEDRIDTSDLMEMDFPPEVFERFRLREGDILLNEGQSPEYLGRPALYRGHPENVAFTNSLLRFRAGPRVHPEWALLVFRRHMHARRFIREVRITTNIAHLSAGRLKSVEFPIPPLDEQREIVARAKEELERADHMKLAMEECIERSNLLRQHILGLAFSGRLIPQDPADEPASVLLERIKVEKVAKPVVGRRSRTKKKSVGTQGDLLS